MLSDLHNQTQPPWPIAHRGFCHQYPENTCPAFDAALQSPIRGIELDLQLTRDEVPVVFHDRTLHRSNGSRRRIRTLDWAGVARLDAGAWFHDDFRGTNIPRLDEVLDHYGGKTLLLLEIKCRERRGDRRRLQRLMDLTLAMARQRNLADQVLILCFDLALLAYGHDQDPTFRFVLNQDRSGGLQPGADFLFAYSLRQNLLKPSRVKTIQGAGKPVLTYTCNQASQVRRALSCGVNAIMTDHPPWLTQLLAKLNSVPA